MIRPDQYAAALHLLADQRGQALDQLVARDIALQEAAIREADLRDELAKEKAKVALLRKRLKAVRG